MTGEWILTMTWMFTNPPSFREDLWIESRVGVYASEQACDDAVHAYDWAMWAYEDRNPRMTIHWFGGCRPWDALDDSRPVEPLDRIPPPAGGGPEIPRR